MKRMHFSTIVEAPKERVWEVMLTDATYRDWTSVFASGSHYKGSWEEGSKMLFLAPDENGTMGGMVSTIAESRPHEFLSIKHLGIINNGVEDTSSEEVEKWKGALENYTLTEQDGLTEVSIDMDIEEEYEAMFDKIWPQAFARIKELAEA